MKKAKILLLPLSALLLAGCTFNDAKNWFGKNVYFPVRNFIDYVINPNGSGGNEPTPTPAPEEEKWTEVTKEEALALLEQAPEAPYKHVTIDFNAAVGESVAAEGHSVYDLNGESSVWEINAEQSTGESLGTTLTDYKVEADGIEYASQAQTVSFKKSSKGRYTVDFVYVYPGEDEDPDAVVTDHFELDKYFYYEGYTEQIVQGENTQNVQFVYTWSE